MHDSFNPGDHLIVPVMGGAYEHHGLYVGDGNIIHYAGSCAEDGSEVQLTDMDDFAGEAQIRVRDHPDRKYGSEESLCRAFSRLNEDFYNLVFNNCEHFVNWSIEGMHRSEQVEKHLARAFTAFEIYWRSQVWGPGGPIYGGPIRNLTQSNPALLSVVQNTGQGILFSPLARKTATTGMTKMVGMTSMAAVPFLPAAAVGYGVYKFVKWCCDD